MIESFGRTVQIIAPEMTTQTTKAFIQPFRYKDFSFTGGKPANIGKIDGSTFLYVGKGDVRLDLYPFNTIVATSEESYVVKKAQKVCIGEDIAYIWAVVQLHVQEEN